jgi:hypothetical protein
MTVGGKISTALMCSFQPNCAVFYCIFENLSPPFGGFWERFFDLGFFVSLYNTLQGE